MQQTCNIYAIYKSIKVDIVFLELFLIDTVEIKIREIQVV